MFGAGGITGSDGRRPSTMIWLAFTTSMRIRATYALDFDGGQARTGPQWAGRRSELDQHSLADRQVPICTLPQRTAPSLS